MAILKIAFKWEKTHTHTHVHKKSWIKQKSSQIYLYSKGMRRKIKSTSRANKRALTTPVTCYPGYNDVRSKKATSSRPKDLSCLQIFSFSFFFYSEYLQRAWCVWEHIRVGFSFLMVLPSCQLSLFLFFLCSFWFILTSPGLCAFNKQVCAFMTISGMNYATSDCLHHISSPCYNPPLMQNKWNCT